MALLPRHVDAAFPANLYKGRDALRVQFDGIDNQGTGTHVSDATTWKSLTSSHTLNVYTECANFSDASDALTCIDRTKGIAALAPSTWSDAEITGDLTIETVFNAAKSGTTMVLWSPKTYSYARHLYFGSDGKVSYQSNASYKTTDNGWGIGPRSLAVIFDPVSVVETSYTNGASATMTAKSYGYYRYDTAHTQLGGCWSLDAGSNTPETGLYPFIGKIHALRFYTRKLTADEVRFNSHIDEARFNYGGTLHVLGIPGEYGTPTPAYGTSSPEETSLSFSPGPLTTYDDGAKAVPVADGVRVKCMGYVLNGDFTTTNAIPTSPLALTDGMSVIWIWQSQYRIVAKATAECPSVTLSGVAGTCVTNWVAEGGTVAVSSAPTDSTKCIAAWRHASPGAVFSAADGTLTMSASVACEVTPWTAAKSSLRYWRGTTASAKVAANWQDVDGNAALPEDGSTVILDSGSKSFTWDLNDVTPVGWIQNGYSGTVTFQTGPGGMGGGTARAVYGVLQDDGVTRGLEVSDLVLLKSGTWTHPAQPKFNAGETGVTTGNGVWRIIVHAGGDFEIGSAVTIDLATLGFNSAQGPGSNTTTCGGSHGGYCRNDYAAHPCYGDATAPITQGSCGYSGGGVYNGSGAIELKAAGAMTHEGKITVSAKNTGNYYGGAGGSVWITAASLAGNGSVTADGGKAPNGSPGAGGRIAFCLTGEGEDFSDFHGTVSAAAGNATSSASYGTIYRETKAMNGRGELEVSGCGAMSQRLTWAGLAPRATDYTFSKVILRNGGRLCVMPGAVVHVDAIDGESKSKSSLTVNGGTLVLPKDYVLENVQLLCLGTNPKLLFDDGTNEPKEDTLHVGASATFTCDNTMTIGGLDLGSGAVMNHSSNADDEYLKAATSRYVRADLSVIGDVTVASGAKIDLVGIGARFSGGAPGTKLNWSASHGGMANGATADLCYGSVTHPIELGAGGQYNNSAANSGSQGAGAVHIVVGGRFTLNGQILAYGMNFKNVDYGTGAGGSVWIEANELVGSGVINVNGGRSSTSSGGGGAGRVAIYLNKDGATLDDFYGAGGKISAVGGAFDSLSGAGTSKGGAGTVYVSTVAGGVRTGTLTIDNRGGDALTDETAITPNVFDACVDNVIVTNGARLAVTANAKLQVAGHFDTHGRFRAAAAADVTETAGVVEFVDVTREALVTGENEFQILSCNTPGKTIRFGTGDASLTTVASTGSLQLQGDEEGDDHVFLRSLAEGTSWLLKVVSGADTQIQYVDVKDSDAESSGGVAISAKDSKDSGNNKGWLLSTVVVGETNTWTGASDSSWGTAGNWDKNRAPEPTDVIVISGSAPNMPVFAAPATLDKLRIESGATLSLGGYDLTVSNELTVAGSLVCSESETLTLYNGPVSFANGHFTPKSSTLRLAGEGEVSFNPAGQAFYRLVLPTEGEVKFADGFSSVYFTAAPTGPLTLRFSAQRTAQIDEFSVNGPSENLTKLISSSTGVRWNLSVQRVESVSGVYVRDSAATGLKVYADAPATDGGNNDANWVFGGKTARWTGASGGKFSDANNWSTLAVPDSLTRLKFDAAATIDLDQAATVREIVGSAGTAEFQPGTNVLTVAGSLTLNDGSTLSLSVPTVVNNSILLRSGSTLTHCGMAAKNLALTNRLHLTVGGTISVASGAQISALGKGFRNGTSGGFGYHFDGASHGGVGSGGANCYGSVFEPTEPGSSAAAHDMGADAGGVIYLAVAGSLEVNGTITANADLSQHFAASGGSIWIRAGSLTGSGTISANGGRISNTSSGCHAGGGRVAVYLADGDFGNFVGKLSAYGSCSYYSDTGIESIGGAPGTVYLASQAAPFAGSLYVDGFRDSLYGAYAQLPAPGFGGDDPEKDFKKIQLVIRNGGSVSVKTDLTVRDVTITNCVYYQTSKPLALGGRTLTVLDRTHRRGNGWIDGQGVKTGLPANSVSTGEGGQIIWPPRPLAIIVR